MKRLTSVMVFISFFIVLNSAIGSDEAKQETEVAPAKEQGASANKTQEAPAKDHTDPTKGKSYSIDFGGGTLLEMVWIPGGSFRMGSEKSKDDHLGNEQPPHNVTLSGFWIGKYEVTQPQFERILGRNPSKFKPEEVVDLSVYPVDYVSWFGAKDFCQTLSKKVKGDAIYKLPTEAQWEYACRAGSTGKFSFGDSEEELNEYSWNRDNAEEKSQPVGTKKPNNFGLYDMHGNLWELCEDWWGKYTPEDKTDPKGPAEGTRKVIRGGSWANPGVGMRCSSRLFYKMEKGISATGFRIVHDPNGTAEDLTYWLKLLPPKPVDAQDHSGHNHSQGDHSGHDH